MSLMLLATHARAAIGIDVSAQDAVSTARPLIEAFLAEKSRDYQEDLAPEPNSYRARRSPAELLYWPAWPAIGGTKYDYACRPIDVFIPKLQTHARFYLRTTYAAGAWSVTGRYREPQHALVRGCSIGYLSMEPLVELRPRRKRLFEDDEVVALTQSLVGRVRADAADFRHETPSRAVPWDVPDLVDATYDEPVEDCRVVSFTLPGANDRVSVGVLITYDQTRPNAKFPDELQTILHDPKSIRQFRVQVTQGCYGFELMRPAELGQTVNGASPRD